VNPAKGFESYFLTFPSGDAPGGDARRRAGVAIRAATGYAHLKVGGRFGRRGGRVEVTA
jgi:hypothetical protein